MTGSPPAYDRASDTLPLALRGRLRETCGHAMTPTPPGPIRLLINGQVHDLACEGEMPLVWALREVLGLTGTKFGCGAGQCGACTVHIDGRAVRSCSIRLDDVHGPVTTIEGLEGPVAGRLFDAWDSLQVAQCGYCQPGQVMSAAALLADNARPDDAAIDAAMAGNLCRCATYLRIRAAIHRAATA